MGFYAALPLPSRPCGSHLTGYTGCREEIPLIGSYYFPGPKHLDSKRREEVSGEAGSWTGESFLDRIGLPGLVSQPAKAEISPRPWLRVLQAPVSPNETLPWQGFFVLMLCIYYPKILRLLAQRKPCVFHKLPCGSGSCAAYQHGSQQGPPDRVREWSVKSHK